MDPSRSQDWQPPPYLGNERHRFINDYRPSSSYRPPSSNRPPSSYRSPNTRPLTPRTSPTPASTSGAPKNRVQTTSDSPSLTLRNITPPEERPLTESASKAILPSSLRETNKFIENVLSGDKHGCEDISLTLPRGDFEQLRLMSAMKSLDSSESYPFYTYNPITSKMVIQFMPTPLHESVSSTFIRELGKKTNTFPESVQDRIDISPALDVVGFSDKYSTFKKIPDLAVEYLDTDGVSRLKLVIEVGFSQSYESLVEDAKAWLEGSGTVQRVILAKFEEFPVYKNPLRKLSKDEIAQVDTGKCSVANENDVILESDRGPVLFEGVQWVGELSSAFIEIWMMGKESGKACRTGDRMEVFSDGGIELDLNDLFSLESTSDGIMSISANKFLTAVTRRLKALACYRMKTAVEDLQVADGSRADPDYSPESSVSSGEE